jgi:acyl carrier protein
MKSAEDSILEYLQDMFGQSIDINIDTTLDADLGLDSLDIIELSIKLESDADIHIHDQFDEKCDWGSQTVGDLIKHVKDKGQRHG